MSTYDGGPFPHSDGHGDNGRGDGGQPGGNEQTGRAGEPEYGAYAPQGQPAGQQYPYGERRRTVPHPANTRRSQASHPTSQAARTASPTPISRRSANSSPASSKGRAAGKTSARSG